MSNITKISKKLRLRGVEFNKEEFIGLFIGHVKENIESMKLNIKRYKGILTEVKWPMKERLDTLVAIKIQYVLS